MKTPFPRRFALAAMLAAMLLGSGCATTSRRASDDDWMERTKWKYEQDKNPGWWWLAYYAFNAAQFAK
jgi:hypothetical protein